MLTPEGQLSDFFATRGVDGSVQSIRLAPDGRIAIAGGFTRVHGHYSPGLAMVNGDGTVDPTFATNHSWPREIDFQSDGKIVGAGLVTFFRVLPDGNADPDFVTDSWLRHERFHSLAIQKNDSIVLGGQRGSSSSSTFGGIIRLLPNGALDPSWDITLDAPSSATVSMIAIHPDDRIIFGGNFTLVNGQSRTRLAAANKDGTLDEDFDVLLDGAVNALKIQPDGKIIIAGSFDHVNSTHRPRIARLNADGSLDPSFDAGFGPNAAVSSLALDRQGRIIAGGTFNSVNSISAARLVRFLPDGTRDQTFNPVAGPRNMDNSAGTVLTVLAEEDDRLLVGGNFDRIANQPRLKIVRLKAEGEHTGPMLDNTSGSVRIEMDEDSPGGTIDTILRATSALGSSLVWSVRTVAQNGSVTLAQSDGEVAVDYTPQPRFYGEDQFLLHVRDENDNLAAVTVRVKVNRIYRSPVRLTFPSIAGRARTGLKLTGNPGSWRSEMNATLLYSFQWQIAENIQGSGLRNIPGANQSDYAIGEEDFGHFLRLAVFVIDDDPLAAGAEPVVAFSNWVMVGREGPGRLDPRFAMSAATENLAGKPVAAVPMTDGRILLAGPFRQAYGLPFNGVMMVDANGDIDYSFDAELDGIATAVFVDSNAQILVGGTFRRAGGLPSNGLVRLHPNGTRDESFASDSGEWLQVETIAAGPDGTLLAGGAYRAYPESALQGLIGLLPDGGVNPAFDAAHEIADADAGVRAIVIQPDGHILAGGNFQQFAGQEHDGLVRLQPNGELDPTFVIGKGFNGPVNSLLLQDDGKILAGGHFSTFDDWRAVGIVRLQSNGTRDHGFLSSF